MARLFGLIGNRADLAGRLLSAEQEILLVRRHGPQAGWGVGFYQGGEVLMRRRPLDDRDVIDMALNASDIRADLVLGHVRSATVGTLRTENTHPFRYRQWLFAMTGTLSAFDLIRDRVYESVPEFLRSSIRGETDAELLFYVFLSFIHDAGRLTEATMSPNHVRDALRSSLSVVDGMAAEVGGDRCAINILASDGERIYALAGGAPMATRVYAGKADADALIGEDLGLRRKTPELDQMHFTLIAGDFDDASFLRPEPPAASSPWKSIPERAIVTAERGKDLHIERA
jgi:predicted glutamine amidotransferase